ncbi:unnamed protein product [Amoebophrya sp. A120]|nr:unnamed protein product [Amoebophrya sp. A120]|eukprot:GSA120T00003114001.1
MVRRKGKVRYNWKKGGRDSAFSSVGYVPQKPFVLSGTIRDNILMGRGAAGEEDETAARTSALLNEAVRGSQLADDMDRGAWTWETEIGERGTTLSGGQQQRLALARAVYGDPDFLVIDDALSAVDGHVANAIFDSVCTRRRSGQTVVIALNQLHFLPRCDYILFVEKGRIAAQGTLEELLGSSGRTPIAEADAGTSVSAAFNRFYSDNTGADEADVDKQDQDGISPNEEAQKQKNSFPEASTKAATTVVISDDTTTNEKKPAAAARTPTEDGAPSRTNGVFAKEITQTGRISTVQTLRPFFQSLGGYTYTAKMLVIAIICYAAMTSTDLWLSDWVTSTEKNREEYSERERILVYIGLTMTHLVGLFALSLFNAMAMNRACKEIHNKAATTVMHAQWTWFEQTPSGRILSRFGADLSAVDHFLLSFSDDVCHMFFAVVALALVIAFVVPIVIPVLVISLAILYVVIKRVALLSMESKRLTNQAFAPVMTLLGESGNAGREVIHAMQLQKFFQTRMAEHLSEFLRYRYFTETVTHAGFLWASLAAYAISIAAAIVMLSLRKDFEPGEVGLALAYSFILPYFFSLLILIACYTVNMMVSLERVLELQNTDFVPQDPPWYTDTSIEVVSSTGGGTMKPSADNSTLDERIAIVSVSPPAPVTPNIHIEFSQVCLRYRPHLPLSLESVNITFPKGSKNGIIGRTGAGKSSLLVALFRLVEIERDGTFAGSFIQIDGVDTHFMGLQQLRRQITVIPQQTLLLEGTLANNLDPFGEHEEEELIRILEEVGLRESLSFGSGQAHDLLQMRLSSKEAASKVDPGDEKKTASPAKSAVVGSSPVKTGPRSPTSSAVSPGDVTVKKKSEDNADENPPTPTAAAVSSKSPQDKNEEQGGKDEQQKATTSRLGLSAGQQQLLAIARALLKKRPIVVMDEPTANIDNHTDRLVQTLVRKKFHDCTLITVAHRLQTILDFDRILVMSDGKVAEDGAPWELIKNSDSHLNYMLDSYGPDTAAALRRTANSAAPSG